MSNLNSRPEQEAVKQQHANWLKDYERWRAEHREALKKLAAIQTAMLEREAALDEELKQLRQHEVELAEYELLGVEQFEKSPDQQIEKHGEYMRQHERMRVMHEKAKTLHEAIIHQIRALCESEAKSF